ncbi:hypothetical protein TNCV_1604591 [Trichonephila clavipes]|nr:hypothetical protein TNCV_1604591 [Trichonephila clavipes]
MDLTSQAGTSTSTDNGAPGTAAPPKKHHVPPITIDNVSNQAGLLKHLQGLTNLKLEPKLIGTKLREYTLRRPTHTISSESISTKITWNLLHTSCPKIRSFG